MLQHDITPGAMMVWTFLVLDRRSTTLSISIESAPTERGHEHRVG